MLENRCSFQTSQLGIAGKVASVAVLLAGIAFSNISAAAQQAGQKTFHSAAEASKALIAALKSDDQSQLMVILGPDAKDIVSSGDSAEDKTNRTEFVQKYERMHRLVMEPDGKTTLYIGAENWPTPIPLANKGKMWYFDTPAGKDEVLYRRIGRNELAVIQVCRELVDAEKEYYGQPHDGDSGNQYAQKLYSDPGKHNGLYWQASAGEGESPIGPMIASAAAEKPEPFHGYYFRILTGQKTSGGTQSYVDNGKMTKGFAFIAYPAEYRASGVMTFIVAQDGIVYERDLRRRTPEIAKTLTAYSRDASWRKAD
jgi:Protein of unknown function (DUF2950)